jgi:phosphoribosylanthranilate isomerase
VGDAITKTRAAMVDVSSGVESSPGVKDIKRVAKFIEAAKAAR